MAIPTMELGHIYEAGDSIAETVDVMQGALTTQRALMAAVARQKYKLAGVREKLTADVEAGALLPYATQRERMRRCQHVNSLIAWLETTEMSISAAIQVLSNPPRLPGAGTDTEQPTAEQA